MAENEAKLSESVKEGIAYFRAIKYGSNKAHWKTIKKRVAIKIFNQKSEVFYNILLYMKELGIDLSLENVANEYNKTIFDLRKAGVELPKMRAVASEDKLMLISQFFGNRYGRKLSKYFSSKLTDAQFNEMTSIMAKTIDAGYIPVKDFIEMTKDGKFVPLDIDLLVYHKLEERALGPERRYQLLHAWFLGTFANKTYDIKVVRKVGNLLIGKIKDEKAKFAIAGAFTKYYDAYKEGRELTAEEYMYE